MLTFARYSEDSYERESCNKAHIDPQYVTSVIETTRRPAYSGMHSVAIIIMVNGDKHIVMDESRTAFCRIQLAKEKADVHG